MSDSEYASFVLLQRIMELGLVMIVFASLLPPHWLSSLFLSSKNKKLKESILLKHSKRHHNMTNSSVFSSTSSADSDEKYNYLGRGKRYTHSTPGKVPKITLSSSKIAPMMLSTDFQFNNAVSSLRSRAVDSIKQAEELPMVVVTLNDFMSTGKIPRSSDGLTRARTEQDIVVFISHRWWNNSRPDTIGCTKYNILCRGLRRLIKSEHILEKNREKIVIWMDYACIDQDDAERLSKGVRSLIAWSLKSSYFLIPVHPDGATEFAQAASPVDLVNYGNR